MMNGWGYDYGYGPIPMIIWVIILIAVVALVVWLGLDVLEKHCARGEINRDEYLQKRKDILG